jgi:hypothetical protein
MLGERQLISLAISEQVLHETKTNLGSKVPKSLLLYEELLTRAGIRIVPDPPPDMVQKHHDIIADPDDVPIVVAAMLAGVDT